jgi:hypothetical protein
LEKPGAETTPSFNFVTVSNDPLVTWGDKIVSTLLGLEATHREKINILNRSFITFIIKGTFFPLWLVAKCAFTIDIDKSGMLKAPAVVGTLSQHVDIFHPVRRFLGVASGRNHLIDRWGGSILIWSTFAGKMPQYRTF